MTESKKDIVRRLEKMIINSSYSDNNYDSYSLSVFDFDLLGVYGVKDVNSFYKKYKRKLYYSERTKFWNK